MRQTTRQWRYRVLRLQRGIARGRGRVKAFCPWNTAKHGRCWQNGEPIAVDMMIEKRYGEHIYSIENVAGCTSGVYYGRRIAWRNGVA